MVTTYCNKILSRVASDCSFAMNRKMIFLATLVAVVAFVPLMSVQADERGYWNYYEYTRNIVQGSAVYSRTNHTSAQSAYALVVSSSGKCTLEYDWNAPIFEVWIANDDTHTITVTWREYFYEN